MFPPQDEMFENIDLHSLFFLESDASNFFLRTTYNGRLAEHARLHLAVCSEDTREVQRTSNVSHKTEAACYSGSCQGM